jgi:hypothetical protein
VGVSSSCSQPHAHQSLASSTPAILAHTRPLRAARGAEELAAAADPGKINELAPRGTGQHRGDANGHHCCSGGATAAPAFAASTDWCLPPVAAKGRESGGKLRPPCDTPRMRARLAQQRRRLSAVL